MGQTLQSFGWQGSGGGSGGGGLKNSSFYFNVATPTISWGSNTRLILPLTDEGAIITSSATTPLISGKQLVQFTLPNFLGDDVSTISCSGTLRLVGTIASGATFSIDVLTATASDGDTSLNFSFASRSPSFSLDNTSGGINIFTGDIDFTTSATDQMIIFALRNSSGSSIGTGLEVGVNLRVNFS